MITRRRLELVVLLMLPLLLLRGLLPAGYMVDTQQGELRVVMCSDGLLPPAADGLGDNGHAVSDSADCPFALSAASAPPVQFVTGVVQPVLEARFISLAAAQLPPATGPPRLSAARAPPASFL